MCGISGFVDKRRRLARDALRDIGATMAQTMTHRGPDDSGVWVDPDGRIALGHRRLSIIDVSAQGHQPMLSVDRRHAIAYNGELYNYVDLKADLSRSGVAFHTQSDTEVLLAMLAQRGVEALPLLDSMFAFAWYDTATRELILARDIFGEKPLYYIDTPDYLAFSSELQALCLLPDFDAGVSGEAIASYLCFQYVPGPRTIYDGVRKLLPGHWLKLDSENRVSTASYFEFVTSAEQRRHRSIGDLADELEALLERSIRRRLISDVPLGAFLSGGVDSSTVAAIATKRIGTPLRTFSIGFAGHADSEHLQAAEIAAHLGTHHSDRLLRPNVLELGATIGRVLDEPNADTSCLPTYLLSEFARETVTVALSGDGGDELFGGYGRYFNTVDEWTRKRAGDRTLDWWTPGAVYLSNRILVFPDEVLTQLLGGVPAGLGETLQSMRTRMDRDGRPLLNVLREHDARNYMPGAVLAKVDRMSMQHSLEVRAPILGFEIADFAMKLSADECYGGGQGKLVLKEVAQRYLPKDWMSRPKRGFGLPMDMWGAETMLPSLRRLLDSSDCRLSDWIPRKRLVGYLQHLDRDFHAYRAWALFILEVWLRNHDAHPTSKFA
jgi:asparagine synthase (glutamine-hydrolysing)